ncbi:MULTISPECIES: hypothetical protein [unclassified Gilliamella]|uniref:hypothetical protein n=1 Tax=unclassified Gilliamella TaxID=2685620 RepID=UPI0013240099|nr:MULTISPECIES: hypothetical protein [unclassified Gilliamella]MWN32278.1 hypothetical protein [Gilliamella sp. Pra-s60]MWP29564.1 hypothetical protein [Gilliamella sp. Pra-s54]MWP46793.1 hypothetical protein [Gilliamella sp. Pas-s27]
MEKLNLSRLVTTLFVVLVLYQPAKFISYYLTDFSYEEMMDFMWVDDRTCYYPGELGSGKYNYGKDCSICEQMNPYKSDGIYIKEGNGYIIGNDLMKKVYLKRKPDYISLERFTGGELYVKDFESGITCSFYSYE